MMKLFEQLKSGNAGFIKTLSAHTLVIMFLLVPYVNVYADAADPSDPATWIVTPGNYAYDMTMTAVLYFDLEESTDPNDRIAAFNENDCRGVEFTRTIVEGRYLAYLRIYGDNASGDTITLYIYDASEDEVVEVVEKVSFVPQANYGTQSSPYKASVTFDVVFTVQTNGTPVSNATVNLEGYGAINTDGAGQATYADVTPVETVSFSVEKEEYVSYTGTIQVDDADVAEAVELELETYTLQVQVTDGTVPLEDITVTIDGYGSHPTNVTGTVLVDRVLPAAGLGINVSGANYHQKSVSVDVTDSDVYKKITISPVTYSLSFGVTDPSGDVENAVINLINNAIVTEDFSSALIGEPFHTSGAGAWQIVSDTAIVGINAIRSALVNDNQSSEITLTDNFGDGYVSFYSKVSSEDSNDKLIFSIDGIIKGTWSGDSPWKYRKYKVSAGEHTLTWTYLKDGSASMGEDCAWLDYITYTSADSIVKTATSNVSGEAMITGIFPDRMIYLEAKSDNHAYAYEQVNTLNSDSTYIFNLDPVYGINFIVKSENHLSEYFVSDATVTLPDLDSVKQTDSNGFVSFSRILSGDIPFVITAAKHETYIDTLYLADADIDTTLSITLLDYETYSVEFEVIDGEVPVQGATISLEGYGEKITNVYGKAVFAGVLSQTEMDYTISKTHYKNNSGTIPGLTEDLSEKYILSRKTYSLNLHLHDQNGVVEDVPVTATVKSIVKEDFVDTEIPAGFQSVGSRAWEVTGDTAFIGDYSIRSADITDNLTSVLVLTKEFGEGHVSFYSKVSSEEENDRLLFMVDGVEKGSWSGETAWEYNAYTIAAGEHTLEWVYVKDGSTSSGEDCAWLDYITYTSADSTVQAVTTNGSGTALMTGFYTGRKVDIDARSDRHEYVHQELSSVTSDATLDIELTRLFDVNFLVRSENHLYDYNVADAEIVLPELDSVKFTDEEGRAGFVRISKGSLSFEITADKHETYTGTVEVVDKDVEVAIDITLHDYETYSLEFEIIDGNVPVRDIRVALDGYGEKVTNVHGKAVFTGVLSNIDMTYEVSGEDYYAQSGDIPGLTGDVTEKLVLTAKTYNLSVHTADVDGAVEGVEMMCIVNAEEEEEDFFSDTLPKPFDTYGNGKWFVTSDTVLQGEYAVRSADIFDNQETTLRLEKYTRSGYISFYYKVSSEANNDVFVFELDGEELGRWSGDVPWEYFSYKIPEGDHTFEWKYLKDGNFSVGADGAWIDYIKIPSADSLVQEAVTDANGDAVFYNIRPYNLVKLDGYSFLHEEFMNSFNSIQNDTMVNIDLARVYDLEFNVSSDNLTGNIPVADAEIMLDTDLGKRTDESGYLFFERISIGKVVFTVTAEGYYELTDSVEIVDGNEVADVQLSLIPEFKASNVITPNGDGYNDYWEIYRIENYAGFQVNIYSAAGEKVYSVTDYANNKWNGKAGDRKLPDGIYYYIITSPYDDLVFEGVINLIN